MPTAPILEMPVRIHTLDNGLSVYLSENHEEPWISCRVAVRAGAAHEPGASTGLAHYLEHMLANKGTRSLGTRDAVAEQVHLGRLRDLYEQLRTGEHDLAARTELLAQIDAENQAANRWAIANELKQAYGLLGGQGLNAYTSHDRTVFTVDVPSNRLEAWARLEGDRFRAPVFRGFPTELETIIEEKNRALDDPGRALAMAGNSLIWAGHPYARDVLGEVAHLLAPSIAATERFFADWYVPNNMAVILAGDFDPDRALELIEREWGALAARELPALEFPAPLALGGERRVEVVHRGDEEVRLIWRTVPREHPDADALMLADMMLDNSSTGLLDTRLEQPQLVRSAGAYPSLRSYGGTETVWGRPRVDQSLAEVEALLREQVAALRAGEFRRDDLEALIANFEVGELRRLESNAARAAIMLDAYTFARPWEQVRTRLARLGQIDKDQVVEVAQRWLGDDLVVAERHEGEPPINKIPVFGLSELKLDSDSHSSMFREVMALETPALDLQVLRAGVDFEDHETASGRLYRVANPNNDLFQLTLRFYTGSSHERSLGKAFALWSRAGVGELDLEGYRRTLFHAAGAVSVDCRRQQTDITMAGRADVLDRVLPLVFARLRAPVLTEDDRRRWAEDVVGKRKQRRETTDFKWQVLKQWALRKAASPYLCEALSDAEVLALELDALREAPGRLLEHEHVAFYAGTHTEAELGERLGLDQPHRPVPAPVPIEFDADHLVAGTARVFVIHHEAAQTKIGLFAPSERYDPDRSALYRVFHEYIGGQAGLVFQAVREARGLAYAAHAGHSAGGRLGDQNLIWTSAASRPDRAAEAVAVMLGLLREFPLHTARFERARDSAIERLLGSRARFRGYGFAAEGWRLRGQLEDPRPTLLAKLRDVTIDDLAGFAAPLAAAPLAIVCVGDTTRMDMAALARLGPVEQHALDDLVVF